MHLVHMYFMRTNGLASIMEDQAVNGHWLSVSFGGANLKNWEMNPCWAD